LSPLSTCFTGLNQSGVTALGRDAVYTFTAPSAGTYSFRVAKDLLNGDTGANPVLYVASDCPAGSPPLLPACLGAANRASDAEEVACLPLANAEQVFVFVDATNTTEPLNFFVDVSPCTLESEPNDTPATAEGGTPCGISGAADPIGDADVYALGAPLAGARVFAIVDALAAGNDNFDLRLTTATDTLEFDQANNDAAFGAAAPNIAGGLLTGANAFLRVNHRVATESEPYRLYAVVQPPQTGAIAESEPNDTIGQANDAAADYFFGDLAGPAPSADIDLFAFTATAGEILVLGLDLDPLRDDTAINGALALLDAGGVVVASVNDNAGGADTTPGTGNLTAETPNFPGEGLVFRVAMSGTYHARVTIGTPSGTSAGAGDYLLSIARDCVAASGPAPTTTPTPTGVAMTPTPTASGIAGTPTPTATPPPGATGTPAPTATPAPTSTLAPTPTPTTTPFCPSPPCEVCDNCIDDDDDLLVDREDVDDCPSADGLAGGLTAPRGKAAVKCAKAIEKAGAKFAAQKLKRLQKCLNAELACVQQKPTDQRCRDKAQARCAKEIAAIAKDETKLGTTITKACGMKRAGQPPQVAPADLLDATGLGYASETAPCIQQFMLAGLDDVDDVAACVTRQHECRVEQMLGAQIPRAFELLERAGRDPAAEFACLPTGSNGADQGLGQPKNRVKALVKCGKAITTASGRFVKSKLGVARKCADKVYACVQLKDADVACVDKAKSACAKAFAKLTAPGRGIEARLVATVIKACSDSDLAAGDLLAAEGLGFGAFATECDALGVAPLDSPASIAECLKRRLECRTEQLLDLEVPRLRELLEIGAVAFP
jgi:hypothetical protein